MKKIFFVLVLFIIGCSDKNEINNEITSVDESDIVIPYDISNYNFEVKEISYSDFLGDWKLVKAEYDCALGKLEHIEDNYEFSDAEKTMSIGKMITKICFWRKPEFVIGSIADGLEDPMELFIWSPVNGAPVFNVSINYSNQELTLCYMSTLYIDNKYYDGVVYETYTK